MSHALRYFFEPKSLAIIGASKTPGKAGNEILKNLIANGYSGKIFPINPSEEDIMGFRTFASVKDIPEAVDLAVFIVPAEKTLGPLRECAEKKCQRSSSPREGMPKRDLRGLPYKKRSWRWPKPPG